MDDWRPDSHLDLQWTDPRFSRFLERLASFTRLIMYDKPGTGLSDPIPHLPTLEERGADITAVLDAAGSERAVLFGQSEGGPCSVLLAATRPDRITSLVLYGTYRTLSLTDAAAYPPEMVEHRERLIAEAQEVVEHWGDGTRLAALFVPSLGEFQQRFLGTFARAAASPRMARALVETALEKIDVRDVLASVHVPTLVLHVDSDRAMPVEAGKLLAMASPERASSPLRASTTPSGGAPPTPRKQSSKRSSGSSPAPSSAPSPTGYWRASCSPT